MPTLKLTHVTKPYTLSSIHPQRLNQFLRHFVDYFKRRGFAIPAGEGAFTQEQFHELIRVFNSPNADTPTELTEALFHIDEMACSKGMEALLLAASKARIQLPEDEKFTPADLALHLWLIRPSLLKDAYVEQIVKKPRSFNYYRHRDIVPSRPRKITDKLIVTLQSKIDEFNLARRRVAVSRVSVYEFGDDLAFLILRGDPMHRGEVLQRGNWVFATWQPAGYDLVIYNRKIPELRIHASLKGEQVFYCKTFGRLFFDDEDCFPSSQHFSLERIDELGEDIQSPLGVDGIERITLIKIALLEQGEPTLITEHKSAKLFEALKVRDRCLQPNARIVSATFRFLMLDDSEVAVTVYSGNIATFNRDRDCRPIEDWMTAIGIKLAMQETHAPNKTLENALSNPNAAGHAANLATRTA
ncbi:hypothetical protein [Novipirellula artificiosorum]|uniref:Uncharacterized protein n=1 Tax=Novipirellula artificiosorum TaxID=2528016 RepID=A0A5C6DT46_9BACT|nr:hypothetical protein [Novipirellula artificiosorum]TWU39475.1 hypothetical protein Poly41_22990 [Novipirellula artificiosorum]